MNATIINILYVALTAGLLVLNHFGYLPSDVTATLVGLLGLHAGSVNTTSTTSAPTPNDTTPTPVNG